MAAEGGLLEQETGKRLSLPKSTLEQWIRVSEKGVLGQVGKDQRHSRR